MEELKENHPGYAGKSQAEIIAMRAFILGGLVKIPAGALPYIREELESGMEPILVATAAVALRRYDWKEAWMATALTKSLDNIRMTDRYVTIGNIKRTTATDEVLLSLQWLGASAKQSLPALERQAANKLRQYNDVMVKKLKKTIGVIREAETKGDSCCKVVLKDEMVHKSITAGDIVLEDQDGIRYNLREFLGRAVTVMTFFYTRCDNPLKCSMTITNLARLQDVAGDVQLAAVTYDTFYDTPQRLRAYGEARGFRGRLLRVTSGFQSLAQTLDLGVNFTEGVVNRHAVELFVLDKKGKLLKAFRRTSLVDPEISAYLLSLNKPPKRILRGLVGMITPLLIVLLPKCPFCLAAYFSFLGVTGTQLLPYAQYVKPVLFLMLAIHLYATWRMSQLTGRFLPFFLCIAGAIIILLFTCWFMVKPLAIAGMVAVAAGAIIHRRLPAGVNY